ncbi:sugar phosphate isomerase/epimerase [Patescibacteria group bacterium]|nr:sugar phosphate isomerase/epimerase [Patescibacteria group bacterium]
MQDGPAALCLASFEKEFVMKCFPRRRVVLIAALAILFLVSLGCSQPKTTPVVQSGKTISSATKSSTPTAKEKQTANDEATYYYNACHWCLNLVGPEWSLDKICQTAVKTECRGIDLAPVEDWPAIKQAGLKVTCALPLMGDKAPFEIGFCSPDPAVRAFVSKQIKDMVDQASTNDVPLVIVFTGMKIEGVSHEQAKTNMIADDGFPKVVKYAAALSPKVRLVLEALNTKETEDWRGHPGYYGASTNYCASIVRAVNDKLTDELPERNFGLVFDFYHMQLMAQETDEQILDLIEAHGYLVDYVHVAGAYPPGHAIPNRSELHRDGQLIDHGEVLAALAAKRSAAGLTEPIPVLLEYIPHDLDNVEQGIKKAILECEKFRSHTAGVGKR